jgi:hypothetical protein
MTSHDDHRQQYAAIAQRALHFQDLMRP